MTNTGFPKKWSIITVRWLWLSLPIFLVMIVRICVRFLIISKSEVWIVNHCLTLRHETKVCTICLTVFLSCFSITKTIISNAELSRFLRCLSESQTKIELAVIWDAFAPMYRLCNGTYFFHRIWETALWETNHTTWNQHPDVYTRCWIHYAKAYDQQHRHEILHAVILQHAIHYTLDWLKRVLKRGTSIC